jgi:tripartite ATP-independent transporter DctM subunit
MDIGLLTVILFASMMILLAIGVPVAFTLGSLGFLFTVLLWGPDALYIGAAAASGQIMNYVLLAVPLFVLMGCILERTAIADELYEMMYAWLGPINGGLAIGTVIIGAIFGAMTGITATTSVTMGLIAVPSMLKRGYDKKMALGCVEAGGALGVLIPPSVIMIIYALFSGESVGRLYAGGVVPGLLLAGLFVAYIGVRGMIQPHLCPAMPKAERADWGTKLAKLKTVILPMILIVLVLGSMFAGIATATEAAAVGALGTIVAALIQRRLTWENLREACGMTLKITSMVMWILVGASIFVAAYSALGAPQLIQQLVMSWPVNRWVILALIQAIWFVLGCQLDPIAIMMITIPVFLPVIKLLNFDPLWFGVIFVVNMEMAYLTPPFGMNLFYMKSVVPSGVTMGDIYRAAGAFVVLQAVGLALCLLFPEIITWLPSRVYGGP